MGFFHAESGAGVAVQWDSPNRENFNGHGFARVPERLGGGTPGYGATFGHRGQPFNTGHAAIEPLMAELVFTLDADGSRAIIMDGKECGSGRPENRPDPLDLLVPRGNEFGYFDDVAIVKK